MTDEDPVAQALDQLLIRHGYLPGHCRFGFLTRVNGPRDFTDLQIAREFSGPTDPEWTPMAQGRFGPATEFLYTHGIGGRPLPPTLLEHRVDCVYYLGTGYSPRRMFSLLGQGEAPLPLCPVIPIGDPEMHVFAVTGDGRLLVRTRDQYAAGLVRDEAHPEGSWPEPCEVGHVLHRMWRVLQVRRAEWIHATV